MITAVWSECLWGLRIAVLATNVEERSSNGGRRHDKSTCISTTKVSFSTILFCGCVTASWQSWRCSQNLCRPFQSIVKRLLFTLFIYAAQFFPYQECNVRFKVRARMQLDLHGIIGQPALHFLVSYVLFTQLHMTYREQVLHRCALHIHTGWLTDLS